MRLHHPSAVDDSPQSTKPFTAAGDGFSVNCAVACEAHERAKLARVCRYMARPPVAEDRLSVDGDGLVVYQLKRAFRDGTTLCAVHGCTNAVGGRMPGAACSNPTTSSLDWPPSSLVRRPISSDGVGAG